MMRRYWVSNAVQEHVFIVRDKGYTQANGGSRESIAQMKVGDWILYYSPTVYFGQERPTCKKFTGISCVADNRIYPQSNQYPDRWRRNVEFFHCAPHHPRHFFNKVSFLPKVDNWHDIFLKSLFEIPRDDFVIIADTILLPQEHRILLY